MSGKAFHARLQALGANFVRYYPAIAETFAPYAFVSKSYKADDGKRTRGTTFDPDVAAMLLINIIDLTGTSTFRELAGSDWFQKHTDKDYAAELGISVHRLRLARAFLADTLQLIDYTVQKIPNSVRYRANFDRINAFFSPLISGWGQAPLVGLCDEKSHTVTRKSTHGDAKKRTRHHEKCDTSIDTSHRERGNKNGKRDFLVVVEKALARVDNGDALSEIFKGRILPELEKIEVTPEREAEYRGHILAQDLKLAGEIDQYLRETTTIENPKRTHMVVACVMRGVSLDALMQHRRETEAICESQGRGRRKIVNQMGFWISRVLKGDAIGIESSVLMERML